jgi:hypothetical protein
VSERGGQGATWHVGGTHLAYTSLSKLPAPRYRAPDGAGASASFFFPRPLASTDTAHNAKVNAAVNRMAAEKARVRTAAASRLRCCDPPTTPSAPPRLTRAPPPAAPSQQAVHRNYILYTACTSVQTVL